MAITVVRFAGWPEFRLCAGAAPCRPVGRGTECPTPQKRHEKRRTVGVVNCSSGARPAAGSHYEGRLQLGRPRNRPAADSVSPPARTWRGRDDRPAFRDR